MNAGRRALHGRQADLSYPAASAIRFRAPQDQPAKVTPIRKPQAESPVDGCPQSGSECVIRVRSYCFLFCFFTRDRTTSACSCPGDGPRRYHFAPTKVMLYILPPVPVCQGKPYRMRFCVWVIGGYYFDYNVSSDHYINDVWFSGNGAAASADLVIESNDPTSSTITVRLTGEGIRVPSAWVIIGMKSEARE